MSETILDTAMARLTTRAKDAFLCECQCGSLLLAPRCEYHHCERRAVATIMIPISWKPPALGPKFFCRDCWEYFDNAWRKPMKGIDRPIDAPDDWKPSLMEHIRWAKIEMEHNDRIEREKMPPPAHHRFSVPRSARDPEWLQKVDRLFADVKRAVSPHSRDDAAGGAG